MHKDAEIQITFVSTRIGHCMCRTALHRTATLRRCYDLFLDEEVGTSAHLVLGTKSYLIKQVATVPVHGYGDNLVSFYCEDGPGGRQFVFYTDVPADGVSREKADEALGWLNRNRTTEDWNADMEIRAMFR